MTLQIPPDAGTAREKAIRDLVRQGRFEVEYATITSTYKGRTAEFSVFADALKIDGVRVCMTAETQQIVADITGCNLLTPKLADLIWMQRQVTLPPFPRGNVNGMATTQAMIEYSAKIDAALAKLGNPKGLISTVGKHWLIDDAMLAHPGMAENYGWHFDGPNFQGITGEACATLTKDPRGQHIRLIQGRGWAHDMYHSDYSQTCVLVARGCKVDGVDMDLHAVLQDPDLAPFASHAGPMRVLRQPGVPEPTDRTIVLPVVVIQVGDDGNTPAT